MLQGCVMPAIGRGIDVRFTELFMKLPASATVRAFFMPAV
jgi:hypothetical protein